MDARLITPANFDPSGKTKYPLLIEGTIHSDISLWWP